MEKTSRYRELIKHLLSDYANLINRRPHPGKETEVIFDEARDHYLLVNVGWIGQRRIRGTTVYVRIRDGKFWIEEDWLEHGIVADLVDAGVPKEDIVLAFQPPEIRPSTEFALA
jgi:hypothetical protein